MIPSAFVVVEALPLTPNGKVDRGALPAPGVDQLAAGSPFVAPRTEVEEAVARIWSDVLGIEKIGALDDFFNLGGHSLLATQVASRIRDVLGVEVSIRLLFEVPTVQSLAARIEASRQGDSRPVIPPIRPVEREAAPPLSFAQESLWYLDQLAPGRPTFNVSSAARVAGPL